MDRLHLGLEIKIFNSDLYFDEYALCVHVLKGHTVLTRILLSKQTGS